MYLAERKKHCTRRLQTENNQKKKKKKYRKLLVNVRVPLTSIH